MTEYCCSEFAFVVRAGDRIGKGLRTAPRDALIADSVLESSSGKAFGIHRTIDQMGAITGPIAAFALLQIMHIREIFFVSLIPGSIAILILIFFVKEVVIKRHIATTTTTITTRPTIYTNIGSVLKKDLLLFFLLLPTYSI